MRTAINLDEDVLQKSRELADRLNRPFRAVINEALRRGLLEVEKPARQRSYRTKARPLGLRPLHAEDASSPMHEAARLWWDEQFSGTDGVYLSWLDQPCRRNIIPTERNWTIFRELIEKGQAAAQIYGSRRRASPSN